MGGYIEISQFKEETTEGRPYCDIENLDSGGITRIYFNWQPTGFGYKPFLVCPACGERRIRLYRHGSRYICRDCCPKNIYWRSQHTAPGGKDRLVYLMAKYARSCGIELKDGPFQYFDYKRPKYKHSKKWENDLKVLQILENMRFQTILCHKRWSSETIKSILKRTNSFYHIFDIIEIPAFLISWDQGIDFYERFATKHCNHPGNRL